MSIMEHLKELRKRLLIAGAGYLVAAVVSFSFARRISEILRRLGGNIELIYITPSEALMTDIKISLLAGLFLALPLILYEVWSFVAPGLYRHERKYVALMVLFSLILFIAGSAFAYAVVLPITITFFRSFAGPGLTPLFSYDKYISYVGSLTILFGFVFQLPLIMLFLTYVGLITPEGLGRQRKVAIFVIFIVAAILTPPDVMSQVLMALPMIVLYEISVILSKLVKRRRKAPIQE